jgi:PadR family transcriptional regulator PadR
LAIFFHPDIFGFLLKDRHFRSSFTLFVYTLRRVRIYFTSEGYFTKKNICVSALDNLYTSCYDVLCKGRNVMDTQLKRGLLDVCVLAAIRDGESYGYQIIKDLSPCMALSESTLYTILKRLEGAKLLTVRSAEHGGRIRKYYRITESGAARIEEFKEDWQKILSIYRFVTKEDGSDDQI